MSLMACYCVNCHAIYHTPHDTDLAGLRCVRCDDTRFASGTRPPLGMRNVLGAFLGSVLGVVFAGPVGAVLGGLLGFLLGSAPGIARLPEERK